MKKGALTILSFCVVSLFFGGELHTAASAEKRDTVVAGVSMEPRTMNPILAPDRNTYQVLTSIFDNLTVMHDNDSEIQPGLAESWKISEDGLQVVFKIRSGVKFHNGDLLTPEDVAFSFNTAIEKAPNVLMTGMMDRMEVSGKDEVTLFLKYPFKPILSILSQPTLCIVNKRAYEADPKAFGRNPVGTGPFKFVSWKTGDRVTLERFDDYYRFKPAYKNLIIRIMTDANTASIALENGELDVMPGVQASDLIHMKDNPALAVYEKVSSNFNMIILNNAEGVFKNKDMRLAVSYAIDRDELIVGALEGKGKPLFVPMAHSVFGYPQDFQPITQDIDKAKEHLEAARYDGRKIQFKTTEARERVKVSEIIQGQLRQAGFNVVIDQMEGGRFFDEVYGRMQYEMGIFNMTSDYPDGDSPTFTRFHSSLFGNSNNYFGVRNPELDKALETGRFSLDPEQRRAAYQKVCEIVRDEAIIIPIYAGINNVVANRDLQGVEANSVLRMYYGEYSWK